MSSFRTIPTWGVPVLPQQVALSNAVATAARATAKTFYTLHSTIPAFFTINGQAAAANGNTCHYIHANETINLYANYAVTISAISANNDRGYNYITEWDGLGG
jgi:hypothetical protein